MFATRSLLAAAASAPTVLRASAFPSRSLLLSLPFPRGRAARNMLGAARSISSAAPSRVGGRAAMEVRAAQSGEIHVIVGPMFAGKTTALLRRVQAEAGNGRYGKKTQATLCLSLAITCFADRAGPPARDLSSMDFFWLRRQGLATRKIGLFGVTYNVITYYLTVTCYELTFVNMLLWKHCICLLSWSSPSSDETVHNLSVCYTKLL
jgi:hypothetical protein